MKEDLNRKIKELEQLAKDAGLDFFPTIFELVSREIMLEACSYGLPVRSRHWSYGRSYQHQKLYGEMGFSKVYEIVFNNDPSYAFLLETNPDIINVMVAAHVYGHCHFFKHNIMFKNSDRNMVYKAAARAARVDQYIEQLGLDKVEQFMDMAFALDNHIDWHKGLFRKKYEEKKIIKEKINFDEFDDLLNIKGNNKRRSIRQRIEGSKFPPSPEKDILWFLANYAPLEEWEKDILCIVREESYYFYPIVMTKIMNEGFASFWHAELMYKYKNINETEHLEFCKCHSSVVSPGSHFNINPYYLGFKVFTDIRERWDKLYEEGKSNINGITKVIEVAREEDDVSFLRNYLTSDLANKLGLFNYGYRYKRKDEENEKEEHGIIELKDRELEKIIEGITAHTINYGAPLIVLEEVDGDTLVFQHKDDMGELDEKYAEKTMEYIFKLWGGPIELNTYDEKSEKFSYYYDEAGFDIL